MANLRTFTGDVDITSNILMNKQLFIRAHDATSNSIAIGIEAGEMGQGANALAIGYQAGKTDLHSNTIVLNASGQELNTGGTDRLYVKPIRRTTTESSNVLTYTDSGEIIENPSLKISPEGDTTLSSNLTVSGETALSSNLTVSGNSTFSSNVAFDTDTLYVNAQGNNVGIGKTVPDASYKLDVSGNVNCTGVYVNGIELTGGEAATNVNLTADDTSDLTRFITFADAQNGDQGLKTDSGLTYNPSTNTLSAGPITGTSGTFSGIVDINNATDAESATSTSAALQVAGGVGIAKKLFVGDDLTVDTNTLHVDAGTSRVGVGTAQPQYTLDVHGNSNVGSITATRLVVDSDTLFVSGFDKVGINTSSPGANLHVEGNVYVSSDLNVNGTLDTTALNVTGATTLSTLSGDLNLNDAWNITGTEFYDDDFNETYFNIRFTPIYTGAPDIIFSWDKPDVGASPGTRLRIDTVKIIKDTNATSAAGDTGALQVAGGASIVRDLFVGGAGTFENIRLTDGIVQGQTGDRNQILMSYEGGTTFGSHAIKTKHSSLDTGNSMDFYVWSGSQQAYGTVAITQVMTLEGTSNVGIGTTQPQFKLDVNGDLRCIGINTASDDRIKYNEQDIHNALTLINKLKPQKYEKIMKFPDNKKGVWIPTDIEWESVKSEYIYDNEFGFIAQDIRNIPELAFLVKGEELRTDSDKVSLEEYSNLTTEEQISCTREYTYIYNESSIDETHYNILTPEEQQNYTKTHTSYLKKYETQNPLSLDYQGLFIVAIGAIQELSKALDEEKNKVASILSRLEALENA
jgi:cytoskeletal protein CcmA (bactofilin family)